MRVLHVIKTSDGASWAAWQAAELVRRGVELHVALPSAKGRMISEWEKTGAVIHIERLEFTADTPWRIPAACHNARKLVGEIRPDLIHSHAVQTTLLLRRALGKDHNIPRIFQCHGPAHMEHSFFRRWELSTAGPCDSWIATSRSVLRCYQAGGIAPEKLFLSYAGTHVDEFSAERSNVLRNRLGVSDRQLMIGNINYLYTPRLYMGRMVGIKGHETVLEALRTVLRERSDVVGVLAGGPWGTAKWYEKRLQRKARAIGGGSHSNARLPENARGRTGLAGF